MDPDKIGIQNNISTTSNLNYDRQNIQTIVDLRINQTLQTGAGENRTYRVAKVSLYFLNSP